MPEIKLTIDCGEKLCGNCRFQLRYRCHCEAFSRDLEEHKISKRKKSHVRCRECLDAEIEKVDPVERAIKNLEREETYRKRREERLKGITVKRCEKLHECDDCHYKNNCNVHKQMRDNQ